MKEETKDLIGRITGKIALIGLIIFCFMIILLWTIGVAMLSYWSLIITIPLWIAIIAGLIFFWMKK